MEVLPNAPRPQSFIGGIEVEGWLRQLERAQVLSSAHVKMPPLSERTVSMPTLHDGSRFQHYTSQSLPRRWDRDLLKPIGRNGSLSGGEDKLFSPPGQWETARFQSSPRPEPVRISILPIVRNGWLPIQRRAVLCDITYYAPTPQDCNSQDQYDPSVTAIIPNCNINKNGFACTEGREKDENNAKTNWTEPRVRRLSGQASPITLQASNQASLGSDSPLGLETRKKGWKERSAAFLSDDIPSGDHKPVPRIHTPLHRTVGSPTSRSAAPTAGIEVLPTKPGFSSIMASALRTPRSHTSSLSSSYAAKSNEPETTAPLSLKDPPARHSVEPVVRRRQVSIIKVADTRHSQHTKPLMKPQVLRHSYSEGDGKENGLSRSCQWGGTDLAQPPTSTEGSAGSANVVLRPCRGRSMSLAEAEGVGKKMYRSTMSLYLCRPSINGTAAGNVGGPLRPLSFAGAFRHSDPSLGGPPHPAAKQQSGGTPDEVNIGCTKDAACSVNTELPSASQPGAGMSSESSKHDVGARFGLDLHPAQRWSHPSAAVKPQESGEHLSAEAILALNAASIIAGIKLRSRISKMASQLSEAGNEKAEDSGSHGSAFSEGGVVRRSHGNAGRKERPHAIHWQVPVLDQRDGIASPLNLKEALELLRPAFIRRSQRRVTEVKQQAEGRRAQRRSAPELESVHGTRKADRTNTNPVSDNHCKQGDRAFAGKDMALRTTRTVSSSPVIKRNKQEEKRRVASQANRLRVAVFTKKLLDQLLRRNMD